MIDSEAVHTLASERRERAGLHIRMVSIDDGLLNGLGDMARIAAPLPVADFLRCEVGARQAGSDLRVGLGGPALCKGG